jgi:hypothetical protein
MKKLALFFFFTSFVFSLFAQTLPNQCTVYKPSVLITRMLRQSDVNHLLSSPDYCQAESSTGKKTFWIVYSDRNGNAAFTSSTSLEVASTLSMNEKLRIAKIENKRALVYVEPIANTTWPKISSEAECKGWVPMEKLLLWDLCLSDEMGVYQKALLCLNADKTSKERGFGFMNPQKLETKIALDPTFRFYYVMKETKGANGKKMVLLATQSLMSGFSNANLYAWVPQDMYVSWNQRSCLEPTWNKDDIQTFVKNKFSVFIYDESGDAASKWDFKENREDPYPYDDDDFYRWNGEVMRYPILDGTTPESDRYQCTALIGNMGGVFVDSTKIAKEKFYEDRKNVNIAIVLDATKSMGIFSESVYQAIKRGCEYFDGTKYKIRIGVMLYRDQADGEFETEWFKFTNPNNPKLLEFIQNGGEYGYKSDSKDKTHTESLFYGMNETLKRFRHPEHSNVMIVVGDCGNNITDTRVSVQNVISGIVKNDVNVVGFQVRNLDQTDWTLFNTDMQNIIRSSLQVKYDNISKGSKVVGKPNSDFSGYIFSNNLDQQNLLFLAEHRHALSGKEMQPDFLEKIMTEIIGGYAKKVEDLFTFVHTGQVEEEKTEFGKPVSTGGSKLLDDWLKKKFGTANVSGLVGFTGWTSKQKYGRDIWMANVFFTHDELANLVAGLQPLHQVALTPKANDRKPFLDAVKQCIEKMAPGTDLKANNLDDVLRRAMGINEPTPILRYPIMNVLDNQKVSDNEYRAILSEFKMNYEHLRKIVQNNTYKYKMKYNNVTYYWIPVQEMP